MFALKGCLAVFGLIMFCKRLIPKVTGPTIGIFNPFFCVVTLLDPVVLVVFVLVTLPPSPPVSPGLGVNAIALVF